MDLLTLVMTAVGALIGGSVAAYTALRGPLRAAVDAISVIAKEWPALKEDVEGLLERVTKIEAHVGLAARTGLRIIPPSALPRDG